MRVLEWITDIFECIINQLRLLVAKFIILPWFFLSIFRYLLFKELKNYLTVGPKYPMDIVGDPINYKAHAEILHSLLFDSDPFPFKKKS